MTFIVSVVKDNGFSLDRNDKQEIKTYTLDCDPLVLACAVHRVTSAGQPYTWGSGEQDHELLRPLARRLVTGDDYTTAEQIRAYYLSKITFAALTQERLSKFRTELMSFLSGRTELTHQDLCMIYSLPRLYTYDLKLEQIANQFEYSHFSSLTEQRFSSEISLVGVETLVRNVKSKVPRVQHFFEGTLDGKKVPVMLVAQGQQAAGPLLEFVMEQKMRFNIEAMLQVKTNLVGKPFLLLHPKWKVLSMEKA